jgi:hypothetical protein
MGAAKKLNDLPKKDDVAAELIGFLSQYSSLLDQQIVAVRDSLLSTVEQTMTGVMSLSAAADQKLQKAVEVLVRDQKSVFVAKSAKDLDASLHNPPDKIKDINEALSAHMAGLSHLDDNVRSFLFAIMGSLSIDDVVRQRLEHVSAALAALQTGMQQIINRHQSGEKVTDAFLDGIQSDLLRSMQKVYTMEDEKIIYRQVFGA